MIPRAQVATSFRPENAHESNTRPDIIYFLECRMAAGEASTRLRIWVDFESSRVLQHAHTGFPSLV